MATYEDYLKKKMKAGKKPLSKDAWLKRVGNLAENMGTEVKVEAGDDGKLGTVDDKVEIVPADAPTDEAEAPAPEPLLEGPVYGPIEDPRSPKEKKRDAFLAKFRALKG